jgi:hypothetical protein
VPRRKHASSCGGTAGPWPRRECRCLRPEPDGHIAWTFGLPAKSLEPGRYELAASVGETGKAAEAVASFEIAAGRARETAAAPSAAAVPDDLAPVLQLAASYVLEYERSFNDLVAEEAYTQWTVGRPVHTPGPPVTCTAMEAKPTASSPVSCRRTTRAEVVFVRLGGKIPWGTFRDVFEVDGHKVREREGRLEALFSQAASARDAERVRVILGESSRYNIGPVFRNINFPTLALMFLHPRNQARFEWKRGGTRRFGATLGVEVEFEEKARPTIVDKDGQGDLPAHGRFWIDPARGTVLRSETRFDLAAAGTARSWPPSTGPSRSSRSGCLRRCARSTPSARAPTPPRATRTSGSSACRWTT